MTETSISHSVAEQIVNKQFSEPTKPGTYSFSQNFWKRKEKGVYL